MSLPAFSRVPNILLRSHIRCHDNRRLITKVALSNQRCMSTAISDEVLRTIEMNGPLPMIKRIVLIRHGESLGNIDERAYVNTADWRIPLTARGREQGRSAGKKVASHLCFNGEGGQATGSDLNNIGDDHTKGKIFFYVSPYLRTRQTLREILREVDPGCVVGIREDPRIAEQNFGNFQSHRVIQDNKVQRSEFGRFFYRFPDGGESGFDVYNRVSGFIGTCIRDSHQVLETWIENCPSKLEDGMTICIVTHGLAMRLFLMRWFQYTVHEFERSYNPKNGRVVVLEPARSGGFELSEVDRIAMGLPLYSEQERFRIMEDYDLLDKSDW